MIGGHATAEGTARYRDRLSGRVPAEHFRELAGGTLAASIGVGTYLGREDDATDALYRKAVARALERGVNVLDTAVNYRHQRSERAIGAAVAGRAAARGAGSRRGRGGDQGRLPAVRRRGPERSRRLLPGDLSATRHRPAR